MREIAWPFVLFVGSSVPPRGDIDLLPAPPQSLIFGFIFLITDLHLFGGGGHVAGQGICMSVSIWTT